MAVYNEILAGRLNRFVQKLLSMKGPTSLVALSPDMRLVHQVHSGEETRYIEGWDLFGIGLVNITGLAGNLSAFRLRNPVNSGIVGVVTYLAMLANAQDTAPGSPPVLVLNRNATTDQPTISSALNWDLRGRPGSTLVASHNSGAAQNAAGGTQVTLGVTALQFANYPSEKVWVGLGSPEIPLLPGTSLGMVSGSNAIGYAFTAWWRERPLEDSEKF